VTRSGRVVFYDYDELALLTECRFRRMPRAHDDIDVYNDETWFHVAENDVFPEEFRRFMGLKREFTEILEQAHGEIFEASWWRDVQQRIASGESLDVAPYGNEARLIE
jgi:isocitrate dehydrogenase kinase/phosphatase